MWSFPKVIIYKIYDAFNVSGANDSFVSAKVRPPIIEKKIIGERIQIPRENFYGKEKKKKKKNVSRTIRNFSKFDIFRI